MMATNDAEDESRTPTIRKLPNSTISLIAAGEVITSSVNVVKELLENSIDAGAKFIQVTIANGGVKLIEILDNGHGIARRNAQLLCQRHTTSKLSNVHDLDRISTFGFRGEALASISEMAEVYVKTFNSSADETGWEASYSRGELAGELVDTTQHLAGTLIKVFDLFKNLKQRRHASKANSAEERKAIIDLVMRYAIHHRDNITMSLKEQSKRPDLVCSLAPVSITSCIGMFFGLEAQENLLEIVIDDEEQSVAKADIFVTYKKTTGVHSQSAFILFINNRLVESLELKKEVDALVGEFISLKHYVTIVYIALSVPPGDIDVNVHPAKTTVTLHYQEEITMSILQAMRSKLKDGLSAQVIPPSASQKTISQLSVTGRQDSQLCTTKTQSPMVQSERLRLLTQTPSPQTPSAATRHRLTNDSSPSYSLLAPQTPPIYQQSTKRQYDMIHNDSSQISIKQACKIHKNPTREVKLRSVYELRKQVGLERACAEKSQVIKSSTFVGLFDHSRALIQFETSLYCINFKAYLKEQYYQFYLYDFGNFPPIDILAPGNQTKPFIEAYLKDIERHEEGLFKKLKFSTVDAVLEELMKHCDMFEDYLSIKLTRERILTLPCVIPNEIPNLLFLGKFLVELANDVDYTQERECLRMIGRLLADFYSEPPLNLRDRAVHRSYHEKIDSRLYVAIKDYLITPVWLFTKENICKISDTKDLFKVFERC